MDKQMLESKCHNASSSFFSMMKKNGIITFYTVFLNIKEMTLLTN